MRILGNLFRFFTIIVLIIISYMIDRKELDSLYIVQLTVFSVLSLSIFIGLDNYKESKYLLFKEEALYLPNWIVVLTPVIIAFVLGVENSFSVFQTIAIVGGLLFLASVVIKLSFFLLHFKRYYSIYVFALLFLTQFYNAVFSRFFWSSLSFILSFGIMGCCFLIAQYQHCKKNVDTEMI